MSATSTIPAFTAPDRFALIPIDSLVAGDNVRDANRGITELAASIAAVGVIEPLIVEAADDSYTVMDGHRRLAAARKAGLDAVPCLVRGGEHAAVVERVSLQLAANLQRDGLTVREEAVAYERLTLAGMSTAQIGKVTGRKKADVDARVKLLGLPEPTRDKVWAGQITLDEAAVLASITDPDELAWVEKAAGTGSFAWKRQGWKYEKERRAKAAKAREDAKAEKARHREAVAEARKSGKPIPEPPASKTKSPSDASAARRQELEVKAKIASAVRLPWVTDYLARASKAKVTLPDEIRALLRMHVDLASLYAESADRIGIPAGVKDSASLTDAQLILALIMENTDIDEPLEDSWSWEHARARGPRLMTDLVEFLEYPISPEELALADGKPGA